MSKEALSKQEHGEPTRHELQAKGEHPAPCARFCEANAFRIAERGYQRQICELSKKLEQLKQEQGEPVAWIHIDELKELEYCNGTTVWAENALVHTDDSITNRLIPDGYVPLYTTPQQRKPLTHEQRRAIILKADTVGQAIAMVEAAHGIKEKNT